MGMIHFMAACNKCSLNLSFVLLGSVFLSTFVVEVLT